MQKLVTNKTNLLEKGRVVANGYCTRMKFVYNKKGQRLPAMRLKEWDFYQVVCGTKVLQLTMGHISYLSQFSAILFDLETGARREVSKIVLGSRRLQKQLSANPEQQSLVQFLGKKLKMQFEVTEKNRRLTLSQMGKMGVRAEIDLTLTNTSADKERMIIATPFENTKQWYLNCKESCFVVNGYCRIDDMEVNVTDGNAVLDWGRGVWPYKHTWIWGNGSTVVAGKHFGFNIGWGFGNTSAATENMFFYDGKAYKLDSVKEVRNGDNFRYMDNERRFVFDVETLYDNFTQTKAGVVNNSCHQVWGKWSGYVVLDDGTKLKVPPFIAFCEHAVNQW